MNVEQILQPCSSWLTEELTNKCCDYWEQESRSRYAHISAILEQLCRLMLPGDRIMRWSIPYRENFGLGITCPQDFDGLALVRNGQSVAAAILPPVPRRDKIIRHLRFYPPPAEWLSRRTSLAELDAYAWQSLREKYAVLRELVIDGDELWWFCSTGDSWKNLAGRAGLAVVRDGKPIYSIITMLN